MQTLRSPHWERIRAIPYDQGMGCRDTGECTFPADPSELPSFRQCAVLPHSPSVHDTLTVYNRAEHDSMMIILENEQVTENVTSAN